MLAALRGNSRFRLHGLYGAIGARTASLLHITRALLLLLLLLLLDPFSIPIFAATPELHGRVTQWYRACFYCRDYR